MPPELKDILFLALVNPATILVGYWVGRRADQMQKIIVGAFAGGLAGVLFTLACMRLGFVAQQPRLLPGIFVAGFLASAFWYWLGFRVAGHRRPGKD
ncbi:MAG: hypothetical protein R3D68_00635 [Hyphomicrobiaceae bacterium]